MTPVPREAARVPLGACGPGVGQKGEQEARPLSHSLHQTREGSWNPGGFRDLNVFYQFRLKKKKVAIYQLWQGACFLLLEVTVGTSQRVQWLRLRAPRCRGHGLDNGYPLQHSCLKNSMDTGNRQATVLGATESQTRLRLTLALGANIPRQCGRRKEAPVDSIIETWP